MRALSRFGRDKCVNGKWNLGSPANKDTKWSSLKKNNKDLMIQKREKERFDQTLTTFLVSHFQSLPSNDLLFFFRGHVQWFLYEANLTSVKPSSEITPENCGFSLCFHWIMIPFHSMSHVMPKRGKDNKMYKYDGECGQIGMRCFGQLHYNLQGILLRKDKKWKLQKKTPYFKSWTWHSKGR